jgi:hypothetical protein
LLTNASSGSRADATPSNSETESLDPSP